MQRHYVILLSVMTFVAGLCLAPLLYGARDRGGLPTNTAAGGAEDAGGAEAQGDVDGDTTRSEATHPTLAQHYRDLSPTVVNISVLAAAEPDAGRLRRYGLDSYVPLHESLGSGVILTADGSVVTNHHVIVGARDVRVQLADGRVFPASVVGSHEATDLALLQIQADTPLDLQPAVLGRSDQLHVGDPVFAIGNPFGLSHSLTAGIISYIGRPSGDDHQLFDYLQTDTPINPGNSGGPLFDMSGEVVGISTAILGSAQGIGFCIPVDVVKIVVPELRAKGEFRRGYLGVTLASREGSDAASGVEVARVFEGTPAEEAGLRAGDRLLAVGDHPLRRPQDLTRAIGLTPPGTRVTVGLVRDGEERTVDVVVGDYDALTRLGEVFVPSLGVTVRQATADDRRRARLASGGGVVVSGVDPGGPASRSLVVGDVIVELDTAPVDDPEELAALLREPGRHLMLVSRHGRVFPLWVR